MGLLGGALAWHVHGLGFCFYYEQKKGKKGGKIKSSKIEQHIESNVHI